MRHKQSLVSENCSIKLSKREREWESDRKKERKREKEMVNLKQVHFGKTK